MRHKRLDVMEMKNVDNYSIWLTVMFLTSFGLIMVYSASGTYNSTNSMALFQRQSIFACLGFAVCFIFQFWDYKILKHFAVFAYLSSIVLILMLTTSMGVSVKGATRWLNIMGIQFQVAEVVKISVIIMMAYMIQLFSAQLKKQQLVLLMWFVGGVAAGLLFLISNDLSSSAVILGIVFGITFVFTKSEKFHFTALALVAGTVSVYVWQIWTNLPNSDELENASFRVGRIVAWLSPETYASDQGYQTLQALYAIGRGGLWGQGLGNSMQKLRAIPEAQNDMIFSIICEELGLFGATVLLGLMTYLCWQLYLCAISARDLFGSVLVTGVLLHISLQTIINVGVNVNLLPNTGIGLPFISYGGTALFCQLAEIAIVLSVGRRRKQESTGQLLEYKFRR